MGAKSAFLLCVTQTEKKLKLIASILLREDTDK